MILQPTSTADTTIASKFYDLTQGTANYQRIGAKVWAQHVYWNIFMNYTGLPATGAHWIRVIGFYPNKQGNEVGLRNSLDQANGYLSSIDKDLGSIFYDQRFLMGVSETNGINIAKKLRIFKKIKRNVTYNNASGAPETNLP